MVELMLHLDPLQVEERRRDLERAEQDRREAILAKNKERDGRLETQRRSSRYPAMTLCLPVSVCQSLESSVTVLSVETNLASMPPAVRFVTCSLGWLREAFK